ncbi:hypothetical protein DPMN_123078 [Dreissena polymorpha]|uniref:C-type lectin domain-containing protein n=2 Tax=Dreissena polymorpha TaxID=45954 RepID=A0A9D4JQY2_DREPO|nr:hypothetical protein DPMN_123078 [Dreissena polymorpha]
MWNKIDCLSDHEFICKYATTQVSTTLINGLSSSTVATKATTGHASPATTTVYFSHGYTQLCSDQVKAQEQSGNHVAQNDSSCYVLFQSPDEWSPARDFCNNSSGHMLTINSLKEQVFVGDFLIHYGIRRGVWLGLNDLDMEGNFTWVTGESVTFTDWYSHPDEDVMNNIHDCVEMLPAQAGVWRSTMCSKQGSVSALHVVVCEYDAIKPIVNAIIG